MKFKKIILGIIFLALIFAGFWFTKTTIEPDQTNSKNQTSESRPINSATALNPMSIQFLQEQDYPGSELEFTETLTPGSNFNRYIASYESEGNSINGLLTIPIAEPPEGGFPIIVFIHGYIPPDVYQTTSRYVEYQAGLASNGFITYKIDLRGHADSEGEPVTGHFSYAYVIDTLNAISSLKKHPTANPGKIGLWGHSNGGQIGFRTMVISNEVDAGVFWAGVVGSFEDMLETYNQDIPFLNLEERDTPQLVQENGLPSENPEFWQQIDPYYHLDNIAGAIQLHHGTADDSVPIELSRELEQALTEANKTIELYEYPGGDHNLGGPDFTPAMQRTVEFFQEYLDS